MKEVRNLLRHHKVEEAYARLVPCVSENQEAQELWLELFRHGHDCFLLKDNAEELKQAAEAGNPWMQYAWARYNGMVREEADWAQQMCLYLGKAAEAGIQDALYYEAAAWRDGDYGMVDREKYIRLRDQAADNGSHAGVQQRLRDIIFGNGGYEKNPRKAYDLLDAFITASEKDGTHFDPRYYHILGDAAQKLGRNAVADQCYERALQGGDMTAWYWLVQLRVFDEDGRLTNYDLLEEMANEGNELLIPESFLTMVYVMDEESYNGYNDDLKQSITQTLRDNYKIAWELGDELGAYFLGDYYYRGVYGFNQDYAEAWTWFARAGILGNGIAFVKMAQMIEAGEAPEEFGEEFRHECELSALRAGVEEMLRPVVKAYQHGYFTDRAAEIEKYYLPQYEAEDDSEDDDGRYDAWA